MTDTNATAYTLASAPMYYEHIHEQVMAPGRSDTLPGGAGGGPPGPDRRGPVPSPLRPERPFRAPRW